MTGACNYKRSVCVKWTCSFNLQHSCHLSMFSQKVNVSSMNLDLFSWATAMVCFKVCAQKLWVKMKKKKTPHPMRIIQWSERQLAPVFLESQYDTEAVVADHKLPPPKYSGIQKVINANTVLIKSEKRLVDRQSLAQTWIAHWSGSLKIELEAAYVHEGGLCRMISSDSLSRSCWAVWQPAGRKLLLSLLVLAWKPLNLFFQVVMDRSCGR